MAPPTAPSFALVLVAACAMLASCGSDDAAPADSAPALPPGMRPAPATNADGSAPAIPFSPATPVVKVQALASAPHDSAAYTQGLTLIGPRLIEGTGLEGQSEIREVERATGRVLRRTPNAPAEFGEGTAVVGTRLYQLTWKSGRGHVYDAATLAPLDSVTYTGEGWGLASDGTRLYLSDGTPTIRVITPDGFRVERTIEVREADRPVRWLNELEWVNGELWANVYMTDYIARIDLATGTITGWLDLSGLLTNSERTLVAMRGGTANGIAFDRARRQVLLTGKLWPRLFTIALPPAPRPPTPTTP